MPGYHQVLVGWDDANDAAAVRSANRIGIGVVSFAIEPDAEVFQATTGLPSHRCGPFADTASENQQIESAKRGAEGADLLSNLIAEHLHCHRSIWVSIGSFEQHLHVRNACYAKQSGLMVQKLGESRRIEMSIVQQVENDSRV